jgi:type III secretion system-like peptide-binding chaperone
MVLARAGLIATTLLMPAVAAAEDTATSFHALLVEYRCPVVDRLEQIYVAFSGHARHPFLVVSPAVRPQDYVQCLFETRARLLCEASSGYYETKPTEPRAYRLPAGSIAALGRLGFSTDDSDGNFQIMLDVPDPPDFNRIADFILKALHDGYGVRAGGNLEFNAPLAPRTSSQCVPVS